MRHQWFFYSIDNCDPDMFSSIRRTSRNWITFQLKLFHISFYLLYLTAVNVEFGFPLFFFVWVFFFSPLCLYSICFLENNLTIFPLFEINSILWLEHILKYNSIPKKNKQEILVLNTSRIIFLSSKFDGPIAEFLVLSSHSILCEAVVIEQIFLTIQLKYFFFAISSALCLISWPYKKKR